MAIEEHENQETSLQDLIDLVERDDLPTNEFTIEDKDPMVILGKLNEVIANLQSINNTVSSSDTKADEALTKATQAIADATQALTTGPFKGPLPTSSTPAIKLIPFSYNSFSYWYIIVT